MPFGSGQQHVGFLVKSSRVLIHTVTQERASDTYVNPATGNTETLHDRPPLVLDATVDPGGANPGRVIVVVNHLRSFIDVELLTPEGARVRAKRCAQAEAIAQLLQELQSANPDVPVISVGDYNAYQFSDGYTDPISVLKARSRHEPGAARSAFRPRRADRLLRVPRHAGRNPQRLCDDDGRSVHELH